MSKNGTSAFQLCTAEPWFSYLLSSFGALLICGCSTSSLKNDLLYVREGA